MGAASPVSFDAGRLGFDQSSGNLDRVRPLDVGAVERATLVLGAGINIPDELTAAFREANGRAPGDAEHEVIRSTLFNREERNRFEDSLPRTRTGLSARYDLGSLSLNTRVTWYGPVECKPVNSDHDETFDGRTIIDLDVGRDLLPGVRLAVGANNLLNTFPEEHEKQANIGSRGFVYSRRVTQFGVNGGFYYGRLSFDL